MDAPNPTPPINLKNEKEYASGAIADPNAETKNKTPIQISVFFLPILSQGIDPKTDPKTVPQRAIDIINTPWNIGDVFQSSLIGRFAPDITTVSKPNKNPANATDIDQEKTFLLFMEIIFLPR